MAHLEIRLRSDLCAGNGESVGNSVDTDVCMDTAGLPYIPSRRLKGCLKQAAYDLQKMKYPNASQENIDRLFGDAYGQEGCFFIQDAVVESAASINKFLKKDIKDDKRIKKDGSGYETDEKKKKEIPSIVKTAAHSSNVERLFTTVRGQTRLENGIKVDNTLRFTRVIGHYDPFEPGEKKEMCFYAPVYLDTTDSVLVELFDSCCKATRHIGTSRNRGLGNVQISMCKDEDKNDTLKNQDNRNPEKNIKKQEPVGHSREQIVISYKIRLDSPVTLPGCDELNTSIPARSVIGCMAGNYLKTGSAAETTFQDLFLNGTVCWSALTPVIKGMISDPVPMMLVKLKNDDKKRKINHLTEKTDEWKKLKPKTMDGSFAAVVKDEEKHELVYMVAEPEIHTVYHNSINRKSADFDEESKNTLYMQDSIDAGMVYGGTVTCPSDMEEIVLSCLTTSSLRFGRSRSAQYAACSLYGKPDVMKKTQKALEMGNDDIVYVILKSDLVYQKDGLYTTDSSDIRAAIAEKLGLSDQIPDGCLDYCRYHTIGGYQAVWQLQKPQIPAVRAGSIYCLQANGSSLPAEISIGGFSQEGMGVCSITTRKELMKITRVESEKIDRIEPEVDFKRMSKIYTELLVSAGVETMQRYALDYLDKVPADLPLARLRLMLSEAHSYEDLMNLINTMKESDVSSEKETSRRENSVKFLKSIYEEVPKKSILKKILQSETGLWEEIEQDSKAEEILMKKWKLPLEIILHAQHYKKER